ncbi:hypothetical protein BJ944DRAFT_40757 [Cunninghamella echinulata]|nr:hypothetical protein BJ944DRAFT_40757 [Cunninghamella echinulata]
MTRYTKLGKKAQFTKSTEEFKVTPLIPTKKSDHTSTKNENEENNVNNKSPNKKQDNKNNNKSNNKKRKNIAEEEQSDARRKRRKARKEKGTICFGCREKGHSVENCPKGKETIKGICYNCGSTEHSLKNCKKPRKGSKFTHEYIDILMMKIIIIIYLYLSFILYMI